MPLPKKQTKKVLAKTGNFQRRPGSPQRISGAPSYRAAGLLQIVIHPCGTILIAVVVSQQACVEIPYHR